MTGPAGMPVPGGTVDPSRADDAARIADTIGLVTVTYSPGDSLDALLDSLQAATTRPVDVVLADNGSTDGSVERAAARPGVRLLRTGSNLRF